MVWSNWKGAVLVLLASVGSTWSQTPGPSGGPAERQLTVHENGKALRCRMVTSWKLADGSTAHQVQVLETAEMLTIAPESPAPAGKSNAVPMRIYHWGSGPTPPPGTPTPPSPVVTTSATSAPTSLPVVTTGATSAPTPVPVAAPVPVVANCDSCATPCATAPCAPKAPACTTCNEKVIWWEEKGGKRAPQVIVTNGTNPFEQQGKVPPLGEPKVAPSSTVPPTTTAAAAEGTKAMTTNQTKASTPLEKIQNWVRPTRETSVVANPNPQPPAPAPATATDPSKKDWRATWGQAKDGKAQAPGQSLVEQAAMKPNASSGPQATGPAATSNGSGDILLNPERIDAVSGNLTPRGINMNSFKGNPSQLMPKLPPPAPVQRTVGQDGPSTLPPPPPLVGPPMSSNGRVPLGAQSVMAASGNVPTQVTYVPVPVATVPDPYRPPVPPVPRVPEPPQPNAYLNAFTPQAQPQNQQPQDAMMVNAFSNMSTNPTPMAARYPAAPGYQPYPSYGPQVPVQQASFQGRPTTGYNGPQNYQGYPPQMQQPIQPVQYVPNVQPQQPSANPAMDRRVGPAAGTGNPELAVAIRTLRESPYPAQREWASNNLSTYDWRANPQVLQALVASAQHDPAGTVRANCVYSLGRMNAAVEPVLSTLQALRNDGDPRVRQEAEQVLAHFNSVRR